MRLLDSRVGKMMARLQEELAETETSIGQAFHSLDLDGDGVLSKEELLTSLSELNLSKRPDVTQFQALLDQIDADADGKIAVSDFRALVRELREIDVAWDDREDDAAAAAAERDQGQEGAKAEAAATRPASPGKKRSRKKSSSMDAP